MHLVWLFIKFSDFSVQTFLASTISRFHNFQNVYCYLGISRDCINILIPILIVQQQLKSFAVSLLQMLAYGPSLKLFSTNRSGDLRCTSIITFILSVRRNGQQFTRSEVGFLDKVFRKLKYVPSSSMLFIGAVLLTASLFEAVLTAVGFGSVFCS